MMTMHCLSALPKRKGTKNSLKDDVVTVESLDIRQRIAPTRKATKKRTLKTNLEKRKHRNLKRTVKERARLICHKLDAIIVVNWVILLRASRNHVKTLILLEKMSKTGNSPN